MQVDASCLERVVEVFAEGANASVSCVKRHKNRSKFHISKHFGNTIVLSVD